MPHIECELCYSRNFDWLVPNCEGKEINDTYIKQRFRLEQENQWAIGTRKADISLVGGGEIKMKQKEGVLTVGSLVGVPPEKLQDHLVFENLSSIDILYLPPKANRVDEGIRIPGGEQIGIENNSSIFLTRRKELGRFTFQLNR
jgi:hypothetical protein